MSSQPERKGGIDPAALATASLAAAISVVAPPGPYAPGSMIIGATILLFIFAYDKDPDRSRSQHLAFSAVCALITLLVLGYPLELISEGIASLLSLIGLNVKQPSFITRVFVWLQESDPNDDIKHSRIPPVAVVALWLLILIAYNRRYFVLRRKLSKYDEERAAASNKYPET